MSNNPFLIIVDKENGTARSRTLLTTDKKNHTCTPQLAQPQHFTLCLSYQ